MVIKLLSIISVPKFEKEPIRTLNSYIKWSDRTTSVHEYKTGQVQLLESLMTIRPGLCTGFCWGYSSFHFYVLFDLVYVQCHFFIWFIPLLKFSSNLCLVGSLLVQWETKISTHYVSLHYQNIVLIYFKLLQLKKLNNTEIINLNTISTF